MPPGGGGAREGDRDLEVTASLPGRQVHGGWTPPPSHTSSCILLPSCPLS